MENNLPISSAIEKIIDLFGFKERVEVNTYNGNKVWCIVDEKENEFLEHIIKEKTTNLAPVLIIPSKTEKDAPLYLFKELSKKFPDRFRYLDFPFNIVEFLNAVEALNHSTVNNNNGNPFKDLEKLTEQLKNLSLTRWNDKIRNGGGKDNGKTEFEKNVKEFEKRLNVKPSFSIIFGELSKNAAFGDEDRLKEFHDIGSAEISMQLFLSYQCCLEYIYEFLGKKCEKGKKVLWIENEPANIKEVNEILKDYFKYKIDMCSEASVITKCFEELQKGANDYKDYDLVLIDIFLDVEKEGKKLDGKDFLRIFSQKYPYIPAFILSASEDLEIISKTLKEGADFYIFKKYAISIPHYYRKYCETTGKIVQFFEDNKLQKSLVGNIRYWRFHQGILWFGDKCYHMINHSYEHSANEWKLLNDLLYPKIKKEGINNCFGRDENMYCLSMAVWLHDIGHNGNERYGAPHEIRDNHGIISGEFILKHYDLLRICPEKEGDKENEKIKDIYKGIVFPFGTQRKSVIQLILENVKKTKKISIPEKIALLSIYHKSNSPVSSNEYKNLVNKEKIVPIDFFMNCNRKEEVITFDDIIDNLGDKEGEEAAVEKVNLKKMVYIFRFIDALDIRQNRVGSAEEKEIKSKIIEQDKRYLLEKLKRELESIIQSYSGDKKIDSLSKMGLMKIFYQDMQEKIMKGESVSHLELPELAGGMSGNLDNYFMLASYASFISVQDGHFDFHSSIVDVEIKYTNDSYPEIEIIYKSNKDLEYLEKEQIVRDPGDKEKRSVVARLIGTKDKKYEDGYVIREYESGGYILKDFVKLAKITLSGKKEKGKSEIIITRNNNKWDVSVEK